MPEKITMEEFVTMIIDREFTKRPFTVKDVAEKVSDEFIGGISRVPKRDFKMMNRSYVKRAKLNGKSIGVTFGNWKRGGFDFEGDLIKYPSEFETVMDLAVHILSTSKDEDGDRLFIHQTPPKESVYDIDTIIGDGSYLVDINAFQNVTWFHRDIATADQSRAFGKWLRHLGEWLEQKIRERMQLRERMERQQH
jgi:hypothetical protein